MVLAIGYVGSIMLECCAMGGGGARTEAALWLLFVVVTTTPRAAKVVRHTSKGYVAKVAHTPATAPAPKAAAPGGSTSFHACRNGVYTANCTAAYEIHNKMAAALPRYNAKTPPCSVCTMLRHDCHNDSVGYVTVVACNCRRMRIKSSGAVVKREPAPATPPANQLCHWGDDCGEGGAGAGAGGAEGVALVVVAVVTVVAVVAVVALALAVALAVVAVALAVAVD